MAETLFRAIGGAAGCRRLTAAFYARVDTDPLLRPLFPGKTLSCAIEAFAAFLIQLLGGPAEDSQRRWWLSLRESHARFRIDDQLRSAWMSDMNKALDDARIEEPVRTALRHFFEESSFYVVNQGPRPRVAEGCRKQDGAAGEELARRWQTQRTLEEAVEAIHHGDAARALA